jgi:hypothetical protein
MNSAAESSDHALAEWTECRNTAGRMDSILADIRKYGFSLVTILLTANALITPTNPVADRVAASTVVIVLLLVLFLMDRYWFTLLLAAVARASELEVGLKIFVSRRLGDYSQKKHNTQVASGIYAIFVLLAAAVALVTVVPASQWAGLGVMLGITIAAELAILMLHIWFEDKLPAEPTSVSATVPAHPA